VVKLSGGVRVIYRRRRSTGATNEPSALGAATENVIGIKIRAQQIGAAMVDDATVVTSCQP